MSMANLLPWRQQRRARCLRFWLALSAASLLMMLAAGWGVRTIYALKARALQSELAAITAVQQALKTRQRPATETAEATPEPPAVNWQPALESLSDAMPSRAWLSGLRYQSSSLEVTGYAAALPALVAMTEALKQVAGFSPGHAGALQQDSQGRWVFTFQLNRRG